MLRQDSTCKDSVRANAPGKENGEGTKSPWESVRLWCESDSQWRRGRDPQEGAFQTALSSRKIQQGHWQFWSQSQLSWVPMFSCQESSPGRRGTCPGPARISVALDQLRSLHWKSGRPILVTTSKISDNKHRLAVTVFQSRAYCVGIPLSSNIQLAFSKSFG